MNQNHKERGENQNSEVQKSKLQSDVSQEGASQIDNGGKNQNREIRNDAGNQDGIPNKVLRRGMLPFRLYQNLSGIDLPLSLYSCGLHPQHTLHRPIGYPTIQCMICFAGEGAFYLENGSVVKMARGDLLFVPSKIAHDYGSTADDPWVLGYMGIEGSHAELMIRTLQLPFLQPIAVNEHEIDRLEEDIRELWHAANDLEGEDPHRYTSVKIYSILLHIASLNQDRPKLASRSHPVSRDPFRASVQFMEQHYMEEINLANIAHAVGYSKQHFQRRFKEIYGINPSQYLQRLRLLKGAELLEKDSGRSVGEIAEMVGLELNYFVRLFKREYGITPARYRSRYRQEAQEKR